MIKSNYDSYTVTEEIYNSVIHIIGAFCSVILSTLICQYVFLSVDFTWIKFLSVVIYGISTTLMFTMSSAYHCIQYIPAKKILKILDHIAIYFAIAGMCTPICLIILKDTYPVLCYSLLGIQWLAVVFGSIFKAFTAGKYKNVSTILYLILGWLLAAAAYPIVLCCSTTSLILLVLGGLLYTIGSIFYAIKKYLYFHCIWHLFVLVASMIHFMFIMSLI